MFQRRAESRKRPREQTGLVELSSTASPPLPLPLVPKCGGKRREGGGVSVGGDGGGERAERGSSNCGEGSLSEGGNSEEGAYDEDARSWGSSGKDGGGSTEESNEASVSDGDYGGGDERSARNSFEERTDGFREEEVLPILESNKSGVLLAAS